MTMAEKEYIERGALAEEIESLSVTVTGIRCGKSYLNEIVKHYKNSIDRIINEQPAADVVEVVRCKDCKKRGQRDCIVNRKMACGDHETTTKANDFCSYGERKSEK